MARLLMLLIAASAALSGAGDPAVALDAADAQTMRTIVDRQIEAFRADDGAGAYALASPTLRMMFPIVRANWCSMNLAADSDEAGHAFQ